MEVYIVATEEFYGNENLLAVFSDKKLAEEYAEQIGKKYNLETIVMLKIIH